MGRALGSEATPAHAVREYDGVRRVVQLFLDGASKGDAAKLQCGRGGRGGRGGYCGSLSLIDHFQLARIEGTWKVVSKLFPHTGGDVPAST